MDLLAVTAAACRAIRERARLVADLAFVEETIAELDAEIARDPGHDRWPEWAALDMERLTARRADLRARLGMEDAPCGS